MHTQVFPSGSVVKNMPANECRFDPWVGKIPQRKKWQPTPVFLSGKSHGQKSLEGYNPWVCKRIAHNLATKKKKKNNKRAHTQTIIIIKKQVVTQLVYQCDYHSNYITLNACVLSRFSHVLFFLTLWTVACQAPLSMGILQARILVQVAMSSSRGSSRPRD